MKKVFVSIIVAVAAIICTTMSSCTAQSASAPKANLKTTLDSLSYAFGVENTNGLTDYLSGLGIDSTQMPEFFKGLNEGVKIDKKDKKRFAHMMGLQIGNQIGGQMLEGLNKNLFADDSTQTINKDILLAGFIAAASNGKLLISKDDAKMFVQTKAQEIQQKATEKKFAERKDADLKFLEDNKSKEGVVATTSGLQYKVEKLGTGAKPTAAEKVKVNYVGTLVDGTEFDSSIKRGTPAEFGVGQVIPGWTEGLQLMPVGSKFKFWIPYNLAYGEQGRPGTIDPFSTLIFEVELLEIVK